MSKNVTSKDERNKNIVEYFINNKATVRSTAKACGVGKSTVHQIIKAARNAEAEAILAKNKAERHIKGGQATKKKWSSLK